MEIGVDKLIAYVILLGIECKIEINNIRMKKKVQKKDKGVIAPFLDIISFACKVSER